MPRVNWLMAVAVIMITISFGSASSLAGAYGVGVTTAMVIDSVMAIFVIWRYWKWSLWRTLLLLLPLLLIEELFFVANILKVPNGGWLPLTIAAVMVLTMLTWHSGTKVLSRATRSTEAELDWLVRKLEAKPPHKVPGTAIFLTGDPTAAPTSLMHNLKHNKILHERNIILTIQTLETPRVARHERVTIEKVSDSFTRIIARYGFMEAPSVPKILDHCRRKDLNIDIGNTSFFLSRRALRSSSKSDMPFLQRRLFIFLADTAADATQYFRIPSDRVVEVGTQVQV